MTVEEKKEDEQETILVSFTDNEIQGIKSGIAKIAEEFGEVFLDQCLDPGLLKDIPVLKTAVGVASFIGRVRDGFFLLKLKTVLQSSNGEQRRKFSERLKSDEKFARKVINKFLLLIDRTTDIEKCELFGKVIAAFAEKKIDKDTLTRLFDAIDRMFLSDLPALLAFYNVEETKKFIEDNYNSLQNLGMCGLVTLHFSNASGWANMFEEYNVNVLGSRLVTILQDGKPPKRTVNTTEGRT